MAGVTLCAVQAPAGSDFQKAGGVENQTFAFAACGDCREPPTPRFTTTFGLI